MARPTVIGLDAPGNPIAQSGGGIVVDPGDPEAMAAGMERILAMTPEARWELALRARAHVEAHCDSRILAGRFEQALLAARDASPRTETGRAHAS